MSEHGCDSAAEHAVVLVFWGDVASHSLTNFCEHVLVKDGGQTHLSTFCRVNQTSTKFSLIQISLRDVLIQRSSSY